MTVRRKRWVLSAMLTGVVIYASNANAQSLTANSSLFDQIGHSCDDSLHVDGAVPGQPLSSHCSDTVTNDIGFSASVSAASLATLGTLGAAAIGDFTSSPFFTYSDTPVNAGSSAMFSDVLHISLSQFGWLRAVARLDGGATYIHGDVNGGADIGLSVSLQSNANYQRDTQTPNSEIVVLAQLNNTELDVVMSVSVGARVVLAAHGGGNASGNAQASLGFLRLELVDSNGVPIAGVIRSRSGIDYTHENQPPVAACKNLSLPADQSCMANGSVDAGSFDPDGDAITVSQVPPGPYSSVGTTPVTLTVDDEKGAEAMCTATVTLVDRTLPTIGCPPPMVAECVSDAGAAVIPAPAGAADNCAVGTVTGPSSGFFPVGTTNITYTATDGSGNSTSCTSEIVVTDTTPPAITQLAASESQLWPPNHRYHSVSIAAGASDLCTGNVSGNCHIVSVTSNEPDNGLGNGDTANDAVITGPLTVKLRAERSGNGQGRIYTVDVQCSDVSGNSSVNTVLVTVPHNQ